MTITRLTSTLPNAEWGLRQDYHQAMLPSDQAGLVKLFGLSLLRVESLMKRRDLRVGPLLLATCGSPWVVWRTAIAQALWVRVGTSPLLSLLLFLPRAYLLRS